MPLTSHPEGGFDRRYGHETTDGSSSASTFLVALGGGDGEPSSIESIWKVKPLAREISFAWIVLLGENQSKDNLWRRESIVVNAFPKIFIICGIDRSSLLRYNFP